MMNLTPNSWNSAALPAATSPTSPMSPVSPMADHAQSMNPGPASAYAMQPDGSVWPAPPQPSRAMSYLGQGTGSSSPGHFQPQMAPDLKRRMTTPAYPNSSHNSSGPSPDMQAPRGAVPYQAQAGMGFTQWPQMNFMLTSSMGVVPYPIYIGDVTQQKYTGFSMGYPGQPGRLRP
jgi:hypothetical protein